MSLRATFLWCVVIMSVIGGVWFPRVAQAATGTISGAALAWSDRLGWLNFNPTNGGVTVGDTGLSGYVWSQNYGWINLSPAQSGVKNDGAGNLSGSAWGEQVGWVDFSGVTISPQGMFSGSAQGTRVGTLRFDCARCSVVTTWLPPAGTVRNNGGPPSNGMPSVAITLESIEERTARMNLVAPEARMMRVGLSLNVLFSPWVSFQSPYTLALTDAHTREDVFTVYAQVQDISGRISPVTAFTFSRKNNNEVLPSETDVISPARTLSAVERAAMAGIISAAQLACQPFLTMNLPQRSSARVAAEVRKLQYFLQTFLPRSKTTVARTGVYGPATRQAVRDFEALFADELQKTPGGVVSQDVRTKINSLACQAQLHTIFFERSAIKPAR